MDVPCRNGRGFLLHLDSALQAVMQVAELKEQVGCGPRPPSLPCHQQALIGPGSSFVARGEQYVDGTTVGGHNLS